MTGLIRADFARGIAGVFSIRVISIGIEFALSLVLTRCLLAAQYGIYAYVLAWVAILSIPATLGFDRMTTREAAALKARRDWPQMRGLLQRSGLIVAVFSIALAVGAAAVAQWTVGVAAGGLRTSFQIGMVALPLAAYTRLRCAGLQGMGHTVLALTPEGLLLPMTVLTLAAVLYYALDVPGSAWTAAGLYVIGMGTACVWATTLLRARAPAAITQARPVYHTVNWVRQAMPFMFILGLNVLITNIDVIMIGWIENPVSAGVYRITWQVATLTALPLMATNAAIAPGIASAHALGQVHELEATLRATARTAFMLALPIALGLALFGRLILGAFGADFSAGHVPLMILLAGQLFSVAAGSVGYLLIMTGHTRDAGFGFAGATALNAVLNVALIPPYGMTGAAIASTTTLVLLNVGFAMLVRKRLQLRTLFAP